MATNFSANQYENAFKAFKLGNWQTPSNYREAPRSLDGHTKIIANSQGHLEAGVPRSRENPWGNFVGTWDLPKQIPGNCTRVTTARTTYAQQHLEEATHHAQHTLSGKKKNDMRKSYKAENREPTPPCKTPQHAPYMADEAIGDPAPKPAGSPAPPPQ